MRPGNLWNFGMESARQSKGISLGKEAKRADPILRRTVTAALPHPPFSLNRIGITRINFYELGKGTLRLINYRLKVRCR